MHWWDFDGSERFWIEIRKVPGIGAKLECPMRTVSGNKSGAYELLDAVKAGDIVYHWHAEQSRFVGRSVAIGPREILGGRRVVQLRDFNPLIGDVDLEAVRGYERQIYSVRDRLRMKFASQRLYLPFQFRSDGLRMVNYYFAKLPADLVAVFFGESGWADTGANPPPPEDGPPEESDVTNVTRQYLQPFRPKADVDYEARIKGGIQKRGRRHETLVNAFSKWLSDRGLIPARNRAIDIGLKTPAVIVEAKMITTWPRSIREAVGQLYEYRYFHVVSPNTKLVFLASKSVPPDWLKYLEEDRGISVGWYTGSDFELSKMAQEAFGF
jgi:hypothetical protein